MRIRRTAIEATSLAVLLALGAVLATPAPAAPSARTARAKLALGSRPRTTTLPAHRAGGRLSAVRRPMATVPAVQTFDSSFTSAGVRYPYTMVGTNPSGGAATTNVRTTVQPLSVYVSDAEVSVGPSAPTVAQVTSSALFTNHAFPGGTGQYPDMFMRTQFWNAINKGAKNWHVKLARPSVASSRTVTVPTGLGAVEIVHKHNVAFADLSTFDSLLQPYIAATPADRFTLIMVKNVVLCEFDCSIGGYHSVFIDSTGPHTYAVATILDSTVFGARAGFYGLSPLSHEVAEWLADPYVGNQAPIWSSPDGCSTLLEVGDPLVGVNMNVAGQVYQDAAYLPWFSRHPSTSFHGRYSWFGTFRTFSDPCAGP